MHTGTGAGHRSAHMHRHRAQKHRSAEMHKHMGTGRARGHRKQEHRDTTPKHKPEDDRAQSGNPNKINGQQEPK